MKKQVDWKWANSLYELAIFEAVGLSLGYELNTLAPVDFRYTDREYTEPPPEYRERVILAYQAARTKQGLTPNGFTSVDGMAFDPNADFFDAQSWHIDPADFRRWCDAESLPVPAEWAPRGYSKTAPAQATPAPVVAVEPASDGTEKRKEKKPTIEAVALDYMREVYGAGQFQSAAKFHKHLTQTAGATDSPFEVGTGNNARRLFCPAASSFFDAGTLGKMWAKIRAV